MACADLEDDDPVMVLRGRCWAQHREYAHPARDVLKVAVLPASRYRGCAVRGGELVVGARAAAQAAQVVGGGVLRACAPAGVGDGPWEPPFVHQLFPGELLFGYRGPGVALRVWVREPELSMAVTGEAPGGSLLGEVPVRLPTGDGGGGGAEGAAAELLGLAPAQKTLSLRVGADDVLSCLKDVLPRDFPSLGFAAAVGAAACSPTAPPLPLRFYPGGGGAAAWAPPGERAAAYAAGAQRFFVQRWRPAASPQLRGYMERLGALALWLIESASAVDTGDERWEVFTVYREAGGGQGGGEGGGGRGEREEEEEEEEEEAGGPPDAPRLVGYASVYRFTNPMRARRPDTLRLSQLVVLPLFQRQGHGERLLRHVHAAAAAAEGGEGVLEVSIEDPCEGMARLRDVVDVGRAAADSVFAGLPGWVAPPRADVPEGQLEPPAALLPLLRDLTEEEAAAGRSALRSTVLQVRRAYLALLLARSGLLRGGGGREGGDEPLAKTLRLLVKRVILEADVALKHVKDAAAKKTALEERFLETVASLAAALVRCSPPLCSREDAAKAGQRWAAKQRELALEEAAERFAKSR